MRPSLFSENESILLVGEGNFSFSVALSQLNLKMKLISTCYEYKVDHETGKKNIEYLRSNGIRVHLGVDATKLQLHPILGKEFFDKVIFNYPHVGGKMRIDKNRDLLKNFFMSVEKLANPNIQILITLCNGQGGTSLDNPRRRWDDSWKITEMAAYGNFLLTSIEPFVYSYFPNYIVTGYRSMEKQFNTTNSLTHIFKRSEPPNLQNISIFNKIDISNVKCNYYSWKDIKNSNEYQSKSNILTISPPTFTFDVTILVQENFNEPKLYEILYNYAGYIVDEVEFIGSYVSPSREKVSRTYRINYKSYTLPLHRGRVIELHRNMITDILENNLNITVDK